MLASTRQVIACILMIAGVAVCGHSQSTSSKEPTASISGKVTFHGDGIKGVVVTLVSLESTSYRQLTNHRGVTDAKGEYQITNVPAGNYIVTPTATAFVVEAGLRGERNLIVNENDTIKDLDFSLMRGGVITGRVVDSDGRPVIEEEIHLSSPKNPSLSSPLPAALTDDRGIYRIFALKPGSYTVAAGRIPFGLSSSRPNAALYTRTYYPGVLNPAQASVIQVTDGSEATNVDITLAHTLTPRTASGRIVNGDTGQPLAGVRYGFVRFSGPDQTGSAHNGLVTNSRGEFKLENLMPGEYAVSLTANADLDLRLEELRFVIVDQDVTGLVLKTKKGGSLSGVVVLEGPADKAVVEELREMKLVVFVATERTKRVGTLGVETDLRTDGGFRFGGLPTGTATFMVPGSQRFRILRVERDGVVQLGGIEVKQGEELSGVRIVVGYAEGSIRGVVEVENGTIPPGGQLQLRGRKLNDNPANASYVVPQIDARGYFVFDHLFPGIYEITAFVLAPGSREPIAQKRQEVVVTSGSTADATIKLDLNPPQPKP